MVTKKVTLVLMVAMLFLILTGCAPGSGASTPENPAGFFSGVWHGWIAPVSLIWGIFNDSIRVYEPNNSGWWYDFGFYIAIIGGFGGISLFRKQKKDKQ
jgi:polyferredoxin